MSRAPARIPLRTLAHGRAGDKDGVLNISVIARDPALYPHLRREATAARMRAIFAAAGAARARVQRHELPEMGALNFVVGNALGGNVSGSLLLDKHGKSLPYLALDMPVRAPTKTHQSSPSAARPRRGAKKQEKQP